MKLLFLADHNSTHTSKWVVSLANEGFEILIFSFSKEQNPVYSEKENIKVEMLEVDPDIQNTGSLFNKLVYFKALSKVKNLIQEFKPEIIHAHYATSYGLLGALTGFHPLIISVWGSDVFEFPSNFFKSYLLKYNLRKADMILSTSHAMKSQTQKFTSKNIEVTPFGVDLEIFRSFETKTLLDEDCLVIGTVKSLEKVYGIDILIKAFYEVKMNTNNQKLKLLIAGGGSQEAKLKKMVADLGLKSETTFVGRVSHEKVPEILNMIDIFVAMSRQESFGVAVLEASACEIPVVVSNIGGLPEVVENEKTGFIVNNKCVEEAVNAIQKLVEDRECRQSFGTAGREFVQRKYSWGKSVDQMTALYKKLIVNSEK